eukprot:CAMPEP_0117432982 /NCGR_PEP_ID=MMETSP0758-20121206/12397_1 /TAXON_ID=63605 /ORGANISM="Percolomonas cosmopolitus, Strain AE-1 (ATCC 50343)" /LENGTH=106 /DNA_ID=CAMNT_0005223297 /DNA_START=229 /DNA_END=546 /DNA_ORIENTATION=+
MMLQDYLAKVPVSRHRLQVMLSRLPNPKTTTLTFSDFICVLTDEMMPSQGLMRYFRRMFYDFDEQGEGFLTAHQLFKLLQGEDDHYYNSITEKKIDDISVKIMKMK